MDKKDIYEHLAKIYLDASSTSKRKRKKKPYHRFFKNSYFILIGIVIIAIGFPFLHKNRPFNSEVSLVLLADAAKINFNFNPAKKEVYSINLTNLNLAKFKALGFSIKKKNYNDIISLRIEFTSSFKEKYEIYVKNIPYKWQDYKFDFSEFKHVNDWSNITNLSFTVEEWNAREKEGVVYLDNIRLLR